MPVEYLAEQVRLAQTAMLVLQDELTPHVLAISLAE